MKKLSLLLLTLTICFFTSCHKKIWEELENLDQRVTKLEELCKEMNTNIISIQTIVNVNQSGDYITGIVEIKKDGKVIGYTITFGKHDPITIYHGQDGKDGQNGADGKDGQDGSSNTPVIGVAKDTDGVYYWTLNGEWLLDDNGNKLPVSGTNGKDGQNGSNGQDGTDGKDGQDGTDGKDGQDGTDGKDGVTPQLKIEDGYWYISYDNGSTWTQLGKATGEDGKDGADGQDGQNGDSMFQSVTQDENYVYFTLADGTVIKIAKGSGSNDQPNSEFIFTITYDPNGGEGVMEKDTFFYGVTKKINACAYSRKGHHFIGWNSQAHGTGAAYADKCQILLDRNITLYAQWKEYEAVDLGLSVLWATFNVGATSPSEVGNRFSWGDISPSSCDDWSEYLYCNGTFTSLTKYCTVGAYGTIDNKTILEVEDDAARALWGGEWRMPTKEEIEELLTKCNWAYGKYDNKYGVNVSGNGNSIFFVYTDMVSYSEGNYWSSSLKEEDPRDAYRLFFRSDYISNKSGGTRYRWNAFCIRPVKDKK